MVEGDNSSKGKTPLVTAASSAQVKSAKDRWGAVSVPVQETETALPLEEAQAKWQSIYRLFDAKDDSAKDGVFAAVNLYCLKNGTSPSGPYKRPIKAPNGVEVSAGAFTNVTGSLPGEIRAFMRADMQKSYECLKNVPAARQDPYVLSMAQRYGISEGRTYLLADWLRRCPYFIGDEDRVYEMVRNRRIADANARRREAVGLEVESAATEMKQSAEPSGGGDSGSMPLF